MVEKNCNALIALVISGILWGAYGFQYFEDESPCTLCLLQRLARISHTFSDSSHTLHDDLASQVGEAVLHEHCPRPLERQSQSAERRSVQKKCEKCGLGMLGVAFGALLNIKFGIRRSHYGLSLIAALFGGFAAIYQIALHACTGNSHWKLFWGLNLYVWSLISFAGSVAYIGCLMLFFDRKNDDLEYSTANWWWGQLAFFSVFFVALANIFTTF
jgi:disulfide bond formation protein DsbB